MLFPLTIKRLANWLIAGGAVKEEDREVYEFGLDKIIVTVLNFLFLVFLGLIFGIVVEAIIFHITFMLIREYSGGFHANTPIRCLWFSIGAMLFCLLAIRFYSFWLHSASFYGLLIASVLLLALLGPIGNKNKMLDELEKKVYHRRLLRNLAVIFALGIILKLLSLDNLAVSVLCGTILSVIMAIIGAVVNRKHLS